MEEGKCVSAAVRGLAPPTYEAVRRKVLELFREPVPLAKGVRKKGMVKNLIKIDRIYTYINSQVFSKVRMLPKPQDLHEFYIEVLKLSGIDDYADLLGRFAGYERVLRRLWRSYRLRVKTTLTAREANDVAREFVGRALSVLRRLRKDLEVLRKAVIELSRVPCFNPEEPMVIVAGMPQVGKSTLVRRVSTAEPEVSPFPFTTKNVILGHLTVDHLRVQILDTPGILDRPLSELNEIERRAVSAIRFLGDMLVFLIDPRRESYYPLESQVGLLRTVRAIFRGRDFVVAVNKVDAVDEGRLKEVIEALRKVYDGEVLLLSALQGVGVDKLLQRIRAVVRARYGLA